MSVTMRDVARKAGVSIKTVSRVVNNQGEISEATRQRVLAVIDELGYRPSRIAQAMVTRRTHTVGLVIPDITNPFFSEMTRSVQGFARAKDYNVFLCGSDRDPQETLQALHSLATQGVDGIIFFACRASDDDLKAFAHNYRPIVFINRFFEHPNVSLIMVDNYRGARLAVDYLIDQGHTAIGMLSGIYPSLDKIRRVQGFRDGLVARGLSVVDDWILPGLPTLDHGYVSARRLLTQHPQVTAIFAYNDLLATGAIRACHELGRRVPTDCAIVGFDDIRLAAMVTPPLTTIHVDKHNLGQQAMTRLLAMLDEPEVTFPPIYLDVELVIRESA